jgi:hypothetical protein
MQGPGGTPGRPRGARITGRGILCSRSPGPGSTGAGAGARRRRLTQRGVAVSKRPPRPFRCFRGVFAGDRRNARCPKWLIEAVGTPSPRTRPSASGCRQYPGDHHPGTPEGPLLFARPDGCQQYSSAEVLRKGVQGSQEVRPQCKAVRPGLTFSRPESGGFGRPGFSGSAPITRGPALMVRLQANGV